MNKNLYLLLGVVVIILDGCTLAPKYTRPEAPIPASWPSGPAYQDSSRAAPGAPAAEELPWREFFADPRLQKVIETALDKNRDLRAAVLKVEQARAMYGIQRAELFPVLNGVATGTKYRVPADLSSKGKSETPEEYNVNLGISSWEIDFFGRIRSLKDQALEEYFATEQGRWAAQILLISEVANAYLALAADLENLQLAQSTLESQQEAYDLIRRRYEKGIATELDLRQEQTRVDAARGDVALFTRQVAQSENALNLLAGAPVPKDLLPESLESIGPYPEISAGLSSGVLLRRPDILQAEHQLKALNASIGAARAAFFPRISLTSALGTASNDLSGLFMAGSATWNYTPQIIIPIFDPRTWYALKAVKTEHKIALNQYEKAIQTAFREVADALAVKGTIEEQLAAQESLVFATAETYRLSNARYMDGIDSFLAVLIAQRSLYAAEQQLITIRLQKLANQVRLYAVLGGGCEPEATSSTEMVGDRVKPARDSEGGEDLGAEG